jgi:hypothetical protein
MSTTAVLETELAGSDGRDVAAGAAADDGQIERCVELATLSVSLGRGPGL